MKPATLSHFLVNKPIRGQYSGHMKSNGQSDASIHVTWSVLTNQRPVFRSRYQYWPIRGRYSGHMTSIGQSQASIQVTWPVLTNHSPVFTWQSACWPAVPGPQSPGWPDPPGILTAAARAAPPRWTSCGPALWCSVCYYYCYYYCYCYYYYVVKVLLQVRWCLSQVQSLASMMLGYQKNEFEWSSVAKIKATESFKLIFSWEAAALQVLMSFVCMS